MNDPQKKSIFLIMVENSDFRQFKQSAINHPLTTSENAWPPSHWGILLELLKSTD